MVQRKMVKTSHVGQFLLPIGTAKRTVLRWFRGRLVELVPYHSAQNLFERFRGFLELMSRFEFEFCRCENYFFLKDSNFWCVHVNVPWPVCGHAILFDCCGFLDD